MRAGSLRHRIVIDEPLTTAVGPPVIVAVSSIREFCKDYGLTAHDAWMVWNLGLSLVAEQHISDKCSHQWVSAWLSASSVRAEPILLGDGVNESYIAHSGKPRTNHSDLMAELSRQRFKFEAELRAEGVLKEDIAACLRGFDRDALEEALRHARSGYQL